jgi:3-oxoacyl-(acyl-carrier-protein) synthase
MRSQREVVITGIGPILPNCDNRIDLWSQINSGKNQFSQISNPAYPRNKIPAGLVNNFDPKSYLGQVSSKFRKNYSHHLQQYLASLFIALEDSSLDPSGLSSDRTGIYEGSSRGTLEYYDTKIRQEVDSPASEVYSRNSLINGINGQTAGVAASLLNIHGPTLSLTGTCSGGALATGHAFRDIQHGIIDIAIATGHDNALVPALFAAYEKAGILGSNPDIADTGVTPYRQNRNSTLIFGEGSVTLVLEEKEKAIARGANILARIVSFAHGNEGSHPLRIGINLDSSVSLLENVTSTAGISRDHIDFVVGHGNGTPLSDAAEIELRRRFFGQHSTKVPWMSMKPIYGHSLACSSSVNIAATALMLNHQSIVHSPHTQPVESTAMRTCKYGVAFSWGMGGTISTLLLGQAN